MRDLFSVADLLVAIILRKQIIIRSKDTFDYNYYYSTRAIVAVSSAILA